MKNLALLPLIAILLLSSCSKKDKVQPFDNASKTIIKDEGLIAFKAMPLADNQLKIALAPEGPVATKMILRQDTNTLATMPVTRDANGYAAATFTYAFKSGVKYNVVIQSPVAGTDTLKQYHIADYQHQYVKKYNYTQVLALHQSLGSNYFDISPSRRYIFIQDDVNNVVQTKKLDLQTMAVTTLDFDFTGSPIRAVSDNELLAFGNKTTANVPTPADPGNDAVVLAKYNTDSKQSTFVSFVSNGYGRISRVINNHVLVTNPVFTAKTASLINLGDLSAVKYSLNSFDFTAIHEYSFNHIIYSNSFVNPANGAITTPVQLPANSGLIDVDDATGYAFATNFSKDAKNNPLVGFSVYKGNNEVFRSDFKYGRGDYFPIIYNISNNSVIFYRHFGFDTTVNLDGYYQLNISTGEITLLQTDSNPYVITDYQVADGSIISVRNDGVYKLTIAR
ncbi:hypothetical protein MUY27_01640 [Mucilaginibacter sp. RS28]|uniref:DUF4374 domain-containing protein n=1 Tax=Mucilaginibacter straminoryzae TaxID=2932774 RepID=A0A9X1WZA0_9SPHI|nr:hypothetical protein [Mucilaginibacter straminoryzae]MCJ8208392.1 hypothetical protein [Mucilaginibacter straminoryzae]